MTALEMVVYSDYLCPWCYVAAFRLEQVEAEYQAAVNVIWKSFVLRMDDFAPRYSAQFINQVRKCASLEEPGLKFSLWPESKPLPGSSLPALKAAKAAQAQGQAAFRRLHQLLFLAYFAENQDISRNDVVTELARRAGLNLAQFQCTMEAQATSRQVIEEHREAVDRHHMNGVPTVLFGSSLPLTGAVPIQVYRQAIDRMVPQRL